MVVPRHLVTSIKKAQDTILICPPVVSQYAALGALQAQNHDFYLQGHIEAISQVRETVKTALQPLIDQQLCTINFSQGAFYFLIKINYNRLLKNMCTTTSATTNNSNKIVYLDFELVKKLIQEFKVAVIPGSAFGIGGKSDSGVDGSDAGAVDTNTDSLDVSNGDDSRCCYLRVAYGALEKATAEEGIDRLVKGLQAILVQ